MLVLRDPAHASCIADPAARRLVELYLSQVLAGEPYDPDRQGLFLVVEPGDGAAALEGEAGVPVLRDLFGESAYGDPDVSPVAEAIEEH